MRGKTHLITVSVSFLSFIFLVFMLPAPAPGAGLIQRVEIPSSLNPVGSGARALGMGGAFIAVADDATAASWNPGGLIQLETPEISVVGAFVSRTEDNLFGLNPEASGSQDISKSDLNYLSLAYPFSLLDRNMIVSLNYQNLYDFTKSWDFRFNSASSSISVFRNVDFKQKGDLHALGLAYAVQLTPMLSLGITFNLWEDGITGNGWKKTTDERGTGSVDFGTGTILDFDYTYFKEDEYSFSGFNFNLGLLWNMTPEWTLGAVLKTPFSADIEFDTNIRTSLTFPTSPGMNDTTVLYQHDDQKLDMPMSYGIGLAYRYSDALTFSADFYRTEWKDFELEDSSGNKTNPITGKSSDVSSLKPTHQVRLGTEYLHIGDKYIIPIRGGLFYDPAPAEGEVDDYFGLSIGSGIVYKRFVFDVAYQYRFGRDVGTSYLEHLNFSQDVNEHTIYSSVIVHF